MNKWIWIFVVLVACLDVEFFYQCQDSMLDWESNPVARWTFRSSGMPGIVVYRMFLLVFALAMSCTRTRWSRLVAPVWGAGHAYLLATLLLASPYLGTFRAGAYSHSLTPAAAIRANAKLHTLTSARDGKGCRVTGAHKMLHPPHLVVVAYHPT
jgi:hypothetical protein